MGFWENDCNRKTGNDIMKIISWNVGRPTNNKCFLILEKLNQLDADIIILTETNSLIAFPDYNSISSNHLAMDSNVIYKPEENRTSIWTKFPIRKPQHKTFDNETALCVDIETTFGLLTLYATIIGVFGGRGQRFKDDLRKHSLDFDELFPGKQICLAGDFNIAFTGYTYPSHIAIQTMNDVFQKFALTNWTGIIKDCVDHIAISNDFLKNKKISLEVWNLDKKLSDHIGASITLTD